MSIRRRNLLIVLSSIVAVYLVLRLIIPSVLFPNPTSTVVLASDGSLLSARIADDGQWRFAQSDSIPDKFVDCIIAFEDRRFRWHMGVDLLSIGRAVVHDVRAGRLVEGGSTLTMQIARMSRGNQSRNFWNKIVEAIWAVGIELSYSKEEILCIYASNAPLGGNVVGLEAASWRYFGRPSNLLSWAECATLAVLPNSPSLINVGRNRDELLRKRNRLLSMLRDDGVISNDEYALYIEESLPEKPYPLEDITPHLLDNISRTYKGKTVVTTIDMALQQRLQMVADNYSQRYRSNHIENIAILVADVATGTALAYVGNSSLPSQTRSVDMVMAERSTGSVLKPFLYASMMTQGEITPRMLIADTPLNLNGFSPSNYSKSHSGAVHANEAIMMSLNVPLVRMLTDYGIGRFMDDLKSLGMNTLHFSGDHYGASLILGGAEGSLWNMLGMYASMARMLNTYGPNGNRLNPSEIHPLHFSANESDDDAKVDRSPVDASSIWYAFEAMSGLDRPEEESEWWQFSSMKRVAWKTGTSFGSRDAWALGVTPRYAVGVWVGNATGEGRAGMTGVGFAAPVMFDAFSMLPSSDWFTEPLDDTGPVVICRKSGMRANKNCEQADTILIPRAGVDAPMCPYCRLAHLTLDRRYQVNSSCSSVNDMVTEPWFVLPPTMEYYYRQRHANYMTLPPMRDDCIGSSSDNLAIIYPEQGEVMVLPKDFSGVQQHMVCHATTRKRNTPLYWHLDDVYLGVTEREHKMAIKPQIGVHTLTVVDNDGAEKKVYFEVR
ncbi:MAG: penicillin-binding protein 1C [Bacteroidales bacterium]|nr:penicillin-binding protein 1C [Bacteroidales bacterium]